MLRKEPPFPSFFKHFNLNNLIFSNLIFFSPNLYFPDLFFMIFLHFSMTFPDNFTKSLTFSEKQPKCQFSLTGKSLLIFPGFPGFPDPVEPWRWVDRHVVKSISSPFTRTAMRISYCSKFSHFTTFLSTFFLSRFEEKLAKTVVKCQSPVGFEPFCPSPPISMLDTMQTGILWWCSYCSWGLTQRITPKTDSKKLNDAACMLWRPRAAILSGRDSRKMTRTTMTACDSQQGGQKC